MPVTLTQSKSKTKSNKISGAKFALISAMFATNRGIEAMKTASRIAEENGITDMTLEEINTEIIEARKTLDSQTSPEI